MDSSTASWILIFGARVACTDLVREIHWDACARYEVKDLLGDDPFKPGLVILSVVPPDGRLRAGLSDGVRSGELFQIEMFEQCSPCRLDFAYEGGVMELVAVDLLGPVLGHELGDPVELV